MFSSKVIHRTFLLVLLVLILTATPPARAEPKEFLSKLLKVKRGGLRMCLMHPRNCPPRYRRRMAYYQQSQDTGPHTESPSSLDYWSALDLHFATRANRLLPSSVKPGNSWPSSVMTLNADDRRHTRQPVGMVG